MNNRTLIRLIWMQTALILVMTFVIVMLAISVVTGKGRYNELCEKLDGAVVTTEDGVSYNYTCE